METTQQIEFSWYDETLYRGEGGRPSEAFIDGEWKRIVPSRQDCDHVRRISDAEAVVAMAESFTYNAVRWPDGRPSSF